MTRVHRGFNRYETRVQQRVDVPLDGAAITVQPRCNAGNGARFSLDCLEQSDASSGEQSREVGRIFKGDDVRFRNRRSEIGLLRDAPTPREKLRLAPGPGFNNCVLHVSLCNAVQSRANRSSMSSKLTNSTGSTWPK